MRFSVLIPAYNASKTIEKTLTSVFNQTLSPFEILVMDDGSVDETLALLQSYEPRIKVYHQANGGCGAARNALCAQARGEILAFVDADDHWHPRYLEVQRSAFEKYPEAAASFTGHINFYDAGGYNWPAIEILSDMHFTRIDSADFVRQYNRATGPFASPSYCCAPKWALDKIGSEPFGPDRGVVDDAYLFHMLALFGPIVTIPTELVAYRIVSNSLSDDLLIIVQKVIRALEAVEGSYRTLGSSHLRTAHRHALTSKKRYYSKILMGSGFVNEARRYLWESAISSTNIRSGIKSVCLLSTTFFPKIFKRLWLARYRKQPL